MTEDGVLGSRVDGCDMSVFLLYAQTTADLWHVDGGHIGRVQRRFGTLGEAINARCSLSEGRVDGPGTYSCGHCRLFWGFFISEWW